LEGSGNADEVEVVFEVIEKNVNKRRRIEEREEDLLEGEVEVDVEDENLKLGTKQKRN
jgi:hypothetical protein